MSIRTLLTVSTLALAAGCAAHDAAPAGPPQPDVSRTDLVPGRSLLVTRDMRLPAGSHVCPPLATTDEPAPRGVIHVESVSGVELDLDGVELRGTPEGTDLDRNTGVGIVVRDAKDVVIRGGRIGGYKVCVLVQRSERVTIEGVHFDGWFGQRLRSTPFAEHGDDWLWPHDNDRGEWNAKYGAAVSFEDCREVVVKDSRGRHGQNGILLTRTDDAEIYDNDFSFLSGWGLGMYRASRNVVSHNVFDYCVRGYSHGVYSRGQDSAGILMFERCCDNVFAYNSATHGGDGVFLFAGRDLVDGLAYERGETDVGGSDRNLWYKNDLRFAAANSLEATFSSGNVAIGNDLSGSSQHGVWGGYSSEMVVYGNKVDDTVDGAITIEHGQRCLIANNSIRNNHVGIELYWDLGDNDKQFVHGPFGQHHETDSTGHWIVGNQFADNDQDLVVTDTTALTVQGNDFGGPNELLDVSGGIGAEGEDAIAPEVVVGWLAGRDGRRPSGRVVRSTFRRPTGGLPAELDRYARFEPPRVPGSQRTSALERGELGGLQTIVMGAWGPWDFRAREPRPPSVRPGGVLADARWDARWFRWKRDADPRADVERWRALANDPIAQAEVPSFLDPYAGDASIRERLAGTPFGLVAATQVRIDRPGRYKLSVVSDDGVRVKLDGRVVVEDWTWHGATTDTVELRLDRGAHALDLEYFQIDGAVALSIELERIGD